MSKQTFVINIPESLDEIPLADFLEWEKVSGDDEEERKIQALRIFCNITEEHIRERRIPRKTLNEVLLKLSAVINKVPEHIATFKLNGVKYGFIPNLDEISTGEFIDLETYLKEPEDLWKAMSVLYRPITKEGQGGKYEIEAYKEHINDQFKFMSCSIAIGAKVFFWTLGTDLLGCTLKYLDNLKKEHPMRMDLTKNGAGLDLSTSYVKEILQKWKQLQLCPYPKLYSGPLTNQTWHNLNAI